MGTHYQPFCHHMGSKGISLEPGPVQDRLGISGMRVFHATAAFYDFRVEHLSKVLAAVRRDWTS